MIELRILGTADLAGPSAEAGTLHRILEQPKRLLLLCMVALPRPGHPHTRGRLIGRIWPEYDPSRARSALRKALHFVRSHLGDDVLRSRGDDTILLDPERFWCDAAAFRSKLEDGRLAEALELYGGDLLPGLSPTDAPEGERWLEGERRRFRRAAHEAACRLGRRTEGREELHEAAGWYRRALELDGTSEPALRGLVTSLARGGDRTGAISEYERFARFVDDELGLSLHPRTVGLIEAVRSGSPLGEARVPSAPDGEPARDVPGGARARRPGSSERAARSLIERADELSERSKADHTAAIELLRNAVELEPSLAEGWARLGTAVAEGVQQFGEDRSDLKEGIRAARTSLELSPHLPEAHFALGVNLETVGNLSRAASALRRASRLASREDLRVRARLGKVMTLKGDFTFGLRATRKWEGDREDADYAFQAAFGHYCLDMEDEGEHWYRRCMELRPRFIWSEASWAFWHLTHGRPDEAMGKAERILRREPGNYMGNFMAAETALVEGDLSHARERFEYLYRLDPSGRHSGHLRSIRTYLAYLHQEAGEKAGVSELLARAEAETRRALDAGADYGGLYIDMATIHSLRGQRTATLDWIERSHGAGWRRHLLLARDPLFEWLRPEDRFQASVRAMEADVRRQRAAVS